MLVGKAQESIQSSNISDPGHQKENEKNTRKYHTKESQEISPFPTGDHVAATNRQESMTYTKHK